MVIKSLMRLKTTKQEVYIFHDQQQSGSSDSTSSDSTNMDQVNTSRSVDEKMKRVNSPEQLNPGTSSGFPAAENFQTPQSKQFVRNYLKTKQAGSVNDLTIGVTESTIIPNHDSSNIMNSNAHDSDDEICMTAVALKNCVPSPYDNEALAFKKGDVVKVTTMNTNGIWRGTCGNKEGYFKFIDVKLQHQLRPKPNIMKKSHLSRMDIFKSKSVSDLLTAVHLENLTSVFVLNGIETTDDIRSPDDLDYLGLDDSSKKKILSSFHDDQPKQGAGKIDQRMLNALVSSKSV